MRAAKRGLKGVEIIDIFENINNNIHGRKCFRVSLVKEIGKFSQSNGRSRAADRLLKGVEIIDIFENIINNIQGRKCFRSSLVKKSGMFSQPFVAFVGVEQRKPSKPSHVPRSASLSDYGEQIAAGEHFKA